MLPGAAATWLWLSTLGGRGGGAELLAACQRITDSVGRVCVCVCVCVGGGGGGGK